MLLPACASRACSCSHPCIAPPGLLEAVSLQVSGALALSATWKAPLDFGFGIGNPYPLLKYQYSVYTDPVAGPDAGTVVDVAVTAPFSAQLSSLTQVRHASF